MRKFLLTYLIAGIGLAACADHNSSLAALDSGPQAPINDPDDGVFQPGTGGSNGDSDIGDSTNEGTLGDGSLGDGSTGGAGDAAGATEEGGSGGAAQEGGSGADQEGGATNPPTDGGAGQPVPEPSTLLLVGTGLAGAALLRRRRKQPIAS